MGGGRESCHVTTGFGDDHLRDLRSDAGNGLQQLDLVLPWLERVDEHRVQLGQGLFDQIQSPQHGAGQPGMVGIEVAGQGLCQLRDLAPQLALAMSARTSGSCSPSIIAVSIARAEIVFRLETTDDNLIDASSNISSSRTSSRVRSPISCSRYRVSIRSRRMSGGGTNDGR